MNRKETLLFLPKRVTLTQAKIAETRLGFHSSISLRRTNFVLSDTFARSGENGSLKRGHDETGHVFCFIPHPGEGLRV